VTEAGPPPAGLVKATAGIATLLLEGIGDTIRYSLTADPVEEARAGRQLLEALGLRERKNVDLIACPSCGRAEVDVIAVANRAMDAFGDRRFDGKVRRIAPYVLDREKQARTVDVEVQFTVSEDIRLMLAGYSADVEIILDVRENTLRIPTEAVLEGDRVFVYLPDNKVIKERTFKSGISNWYFTEVISGLKPDELVVVNVDRAGMKDGVTAMVSKEER
jgi:multidrug efflux pump subunit AcrA (membrane-fusion protein)